MSQLELFDKMITVKVCSPKGHQTFALELSETKEFIIRETKNSRKWIYIDGIQMDPKNINTNLISFSKFVILTNALVGG